MGIPIDFRTTHIRTQTKPGTSWDDYDSIRASHLAIARELAQTLQIAEREVRELMDQVNRATTNEETYIVFKRFIHHQDATEADVKALRMKLNDLQKRINEIPARQRRQRMWDVQISALVQLIEVTADSVLYCEEMTEFHQLAKDYCQGFEFVESYMRSE